MLGAIRSFVDMVESDDLPALAAIHEASFDHSWSVDEIAALLADSAVVRGLVMRREPLIGPRRAVGFVMVRTVVDESEILTVAVDPAFRSRGFGRRLIEEAMRRLYHDRVASLFLEVDEDNAPAILLYRALGFEVVGQRAGYYAHPGGDPSSALVMRVQLR